MSFDSRLTPARPDLAAAHLAGTVKAPAYAHGALYQVSAAIAPIRAAPAPDARQENQALHGETFVVYEERDGFGWGQATIDAYVGWVDMEALSAPALTPTHRIAALRTYCFSEPDLKSAPLFLLTLNARVVVEAREGRYAKIARAGWVHEAALSPIDAATADWVAAAEMFLHTPYFWGGRESLGLDCSGLIQAALHAAGKPCPRDADMQQGTLGRPVDPTCPLQRGDLIFWRDHVGVMLDARRILHANAFHMRVAAEPLEEAIARIGQAIGPIQMVKRL